MTRFLAAVLLLAAAAATRAQTSVQNGVVRLDPALDALIRTNAKAELLKGDYFGAVEGPVWVDDTQGGYLLFSDMAANAIYKWTPAGMTDRNVTRLEKDGSRTTLADTYDGKRLNSPNDLVVKSDGAST